MSIELLAPAGSPEALDAAIAEGADAVYLGLKNFNARMRTANFTYAQFEAAVRALRRMGKKLYVTVNTVFEQREADRMYQLLKYLSSVGPDALIVQDFGVLAMARSEFPALKLHASTQMNIASARGCNSLSRHGVSRVVLARELTLAELRAIRGETNVELEVFVHGALCVSASGLCLFSSYLGGKSANRGMCTQACRRLYHSSDDETGYYFSPADLQLLERLPDLDAAGINSVKIEGRMKSADYVGAVVSAYRLVLDAIADGNAEHIRNSIEKGQHILRGDFARSKTTFYFDAAFDAVNGEKRVDWLNPAQDGGTGIYVGVIQKTRGGPGERQALVSGGTNGIPATGDSIRLHRRDDSGRVSHKLHYVETAAAGDGGFTGESNACWLSIPDGFDKGDRVYLIQTRSLSKRYRPVIANNGGASRRQPGHDKAPFPAIVPSGTARHKNKPAPFPDGLYVTVSRINELYMVQSSRPAKVMLTLNVKNALALLNGRKQPLPFKSSDIIGVMEPFFPQSAAEEFAGLVQPLVESGFCQFVINNPGQFSLFRDFRQEVQLIAGPWLYTFNSWALSYVASLGADGFVSPLENNRQNLERTLDAENSRLLRSMFFVPVFAWPPLFRIRAGLGSFYNFRQFSDNRDARFSLVSEKDYALVIPEKPFSIIDKIPFLKEAGFRRFIIDLSGPPLKKNDYKDLMRAVQDSTPLPRISRFNWKDGFYNPEKPATVNGG